ncbi:MAG: Glycosyl transferase family 1 [Parcubacteria group bacterium GW2011_GWF2_44_8b]|nr:MAG: Glycosyl transferase family 1 [Parcubacteria group bacterium GW2011_GWC1_43_30]KKT79448.1 MAG: Glycosyl transferase family 1 [Parcubacteria group bacterium GW2011_GWF2_44_8b]KKT85723.1 MAG: Glycosyl transferase family 1 [Parcubacteria group bacterium GW2011_GWD1_44_9]
MKICYFTHDIKKNTGSGIFSRNLADAVLKLRLDWQIDFLVSDSGADKGESHVLSVNRRDILKNFFKIRRVLKKYDLVHALDGFPYGFLAVLATIGTGRPVFVTGVGSGAIFTPNSFLRNFLLKFGYRKARQVFAISSYISKRIKEKMPNLNIHTINLGLGQEFTGKHSEIPDIPEPYILTVGYIKRRKGYEYSISAFARSLEKIPGLSYVIVGIPSDNDYKKELLDLIVKLDVKDKVFFYSDLKPDELDFVYSRAKLFLLMPQETPNDVEGFGMVYLEAASHGLPVIGSKDSSAEDAVLNGNNGFLVLAKDVDATGDVIVKIISDEKLAQGLSEESRKFAALMTWEKTAKEYLEYYEKY